MFEYAPMIRAIRIQVNKIQFNSLIIISLDAFVYFLSFVYSFTSFAAEKNMDENAKWTQRAARLKFKK